MTKPSSRWCLALVFVASTSACLAERTSTADLKAAAAAARAADAALADGAASDAQPGDAGQADAEADAPATDAAATATDADAALADDSADTADITDAQDAPAIVDTDTAPADPCAAVNCDDGNPCTDDACDKAKGCVHPANDAACDDGNACTAGDACLQGACTPGASVCTCSSDAECAGKDDGNLCNGALFCDKSVVPTVCKVKPGSVIICAVASAGSCMQDVCNPASGKCAAAPVSDGKACDDASKCTGSDACSGGVCGGVETSCDDQNPCTDDACNAKAGCVHAVKTGSCGAGKMCTGGNCVAVQSGFAMRGAFQSLGDAASGAFRMVDSGWLADRACNASHCMEGGFAP